MKLMWASFHIYTSGDHDRLLVEGLAPWLKRETSEGRIDAFFYIRYFSEGPHIRLRIKPRGTDLSDHWSEEARSCLQDILRRTAPPRPDIPFIWADPFLDGRVLPIAYVPETDRFGDGCAMNLAEELFALSSELVLKAIAATPGLPQRHGAAADLTIAAIAGGCPDKNQAAHFLKAYAAMVDEVSMGGSAVQQLPSAGGPPPAPQRQRADWARPWQHVITCYLRAIEERRGGMTANQRFRLLASHIHLTNNRLGLGVGEEQRLALFLLGRSPIETTS
jgi:hypothetical protein